MSRDGDANKKPGDKAMDALRDVVRREKDQTEPEKDKSQSDELDAVREIVRRQHD